MATNQKEHPQEDMDCNVEQKVPDPVMEAILQSYGHCGRDDVMGDMMDFGATNMAQSDPINASIVQSYNHYVGMGRIYDMAWQRSNQEEVAKAKKMIKVESPLEREAIEDIPMREEATKDIPMEEEEKKSKKRVHEGADANQQQCSKRNRAL